MSSTTNAKKRKGSGEPRKAKYMKKILGDDKATKASSFKNRMPTLLTKSYQLETLCGVSVCVVCFDADGNVETWPRDKADAEARVYGYKDKAKRESDVFALLEGTKKGLVRKVAACFSDLADRLSSGERLDAELKRIEEKIGMLRSEEDQRVVATDQGRENVSLEDEFYKYLSDSFGPNGSELVKMETLTSPIQDNPNNALIAMDNKHRVIATDQGRRDTDLGFGPNGCELVKVETLTSPVQDSALVPMENGTSCSFEDDFFLGLEDIIMGPNFTDLVKGNDFGNLIQEYNSNSLITVHNSCMDLDDTVLSPNPNYNYSAKAEDFGEPIRVDTNSSLAVGDKNNNTSCSFFGDSIYLDDIVGPSFTFDGSNGFDGMGFGGMGGGFGFGGFC